ncbi:hypothetical protein CR513_37069, partial [Mucuna pruriens]
MKRIFLEKLFPNPKQHQSRRRYLLIQYFYEGLILMDRSMIDSTSGRALMNKTPTTTRNLIFNMADNTQQFGVRGFSTSRVVNEGLENKITELTSLIRWLAIGQHHTSPPTRVCDIYASVEHPTNTCPTLQETEPNGAIVAAMMGGQQYGQPHNQYSNQRYSSMQDIPQNQQRYQPPIPKYQAPPFRQQQPLQQNNSSPSLEDLVKHMTTINFQFQQNMTTTIQDLQTQIGQLATIVNQLFAYATIDQTSSTSQPEQSKQENLS